MKLVRNLLILLTLFYCGSISAAPRVAVTIPPLHSLVSALMAGATEPKLLLAPDTDTSLDPFQKSQVITADLVIWVGAGLETSLAKTLEQMPMLDQKLITLSNYVPLLRHKDHEGVALSRQYARDLEFLSDPRLAIMAVRMITPRLVRLDPDNQELYLDNEIALIGKLKNLEMQITTMMKPFEDVAHSHPSMVGLDQYFSHRFLASALLSDDDTYEFHKVSTTSTTTCSIEENKTGELTLGRFFYFESMLQTAKSVSSCLNDIRKLSIASTKIKEVIDET